MVEGPVWIYLLFADITSNSIRKWTPNAGVQKTDPVKRMAAKAGGGSLAILRQIGELDAVVREHGMDPIGTAAISVWRNLGAACISARSTNSTKANFEVRSMATKR